MNKSTKASNEPEAIFARVKVARYMLGGMSNASFYNHVKLGNLIIVKDGRRSLVPLTSIYAFANILKGDK
jgi:hypothetical protein